MKVQIENAMPGEGCSRLPQVKVVHNCQEMKDRT